MTNGEKFKEVFQISQVDEGELYAYIWLPNHDAAEFSIDWWNAEYKEPTTKNNLGVDCISRQEVLELIADYELSMGQVVKGIHALPSVTPQEPRWISVSERLPDEGYSVLVMRITDDNYKYMRVATYQGDCWMDDTDKFNKPNPHKVIAWMPLPREYGEVEK